MTYLEKLKDPRWQKKRLEIMERDRWRCLDCNEEDKTLHVHHHHYFKGDPWDTPNSLLSTLCEECHETRQPLEEDLKTMLGQIMARADLNELHGLINSGVWFLEEKQRQPVFHPAQEAIRGKWSKLLCFKVWGLSMDQIIKAVNAQP